MAQGVALGAIGFVLVVAAVGLFGGYRITGLAHPLKTTIIVALAQLTTLMLVGVTEELWFRGFPLQAAARGIGFWPAAGLTSLAFGLSHVGNVGMTWQGVAMISMAGMAICLIRWLTGSLWFGIGSHCAWDYMELVVFATSGGSRLLDARTSGPDWLTGGGAGLESSMLSGGVELLLLLVPIALFWRRRPSATARPRASAQELER